MKENYSITQYKHAMELMHAALPYANGTSKANLKIFIKVGELMDSFSETKESQVSACDLSEKELDMEGLLQSLQSVSTRKEAELINTLLNFFKTQKIYKTYQSMKDFLPDSDDAGNNKNKILPFIENFFQYPPEQVERSSLS